MVRLPQEKDDIDHVATQEQLVIIGKQLYRADAVGDPRGQYLPGGSGN